MCPLINKQNSMCSNLQSSECTNLNTNQCVSIYLIKTTAPRITLMRPAASTRLYLVSLPTTGISGNTATITHDTDQAVWMTCRFLTNKLVLGWMKGHVAMTRRPTDKSSRQKKLKTCIGGQRWGQLVNMLQWYSNRNRFV